jgi:small GTP-binding protein
LIGDAGVGKTCVLLRYTNDSFNSIVNTTIGIDFIIKKLSFNKKRLRVQIWDTAGHESFRHITRSYYRGVDAVMLLYDVTNRSTLDGIRRWINDLMSPPPSCKNNNVICGDDNKVYKILIGCKCDLNSYRKITWEEGNAMAKEFKMDFFEVSAKTNYNIIEAFSKLYDDVMQSKYDDVMRGSSIASSLPLISSDYSHHHHHPRQPSSKNNNNNRSLRDEMMSSMFQDHAVPIMLYGSSSWWNKVKINGIYVPDCLHNYALREHRALHQSFGLFWYRNISTATTTVLVYEDNDNDGGGGGGGGGTWYVKDGTSILASISSNIRSTTQFELPHKILSTVWKERVRILFFYWTTDSPNLKCIPYDDDDAKDTKPAADMFFFKAKKKKDDDDDDNDKDDDDQEGYVNMDLFVEYSKHPESLGLTVPLFVRFCQIKIAVLELNYDEIIVRRRRRRAGSSSSSSSSSSSETVVACMDPVSELEHIYQQREEVEDRCSALLSSLAQQETIKLLEIDRDTIMQAIDLLIIDLNLLFDTLVNIKNGNFTMAKNCQTTITELINTKTALELSCSLTSSLTDLIDRKDKNNDDKNDDNNSSCGNDNNNNINIHTDLDESRIRQIIIDDNPNLLSPIDSRTKSQSKAYEFIRNVVTVADSNNNNNNNNYQGNNNKAKKYSWYIKHCEIKWVTIHEIKNSTDNDLEEKVHVTTGNEMALFTHKRSEICD